jgi:polygalacturonase
MEKEVHTMFFFLLAFFGYTYELVAKNYLASLFGITSDIVTLHTRFIQVAIDHTHANGGGRLVLSVGQYPSGSIHLKSKVDIHFCV